MKIISQIDPKYASITFPGTPYRWHNYGCLASCLCMLLEKEVEDFIKENPKGWTADGNLKTDEVLAKYGYKLVRKPLKEGEPLETFPYPVIMRTSFFSPKYATHFFVQQADSHDIVDPASMHNPKSDNRYANRVNEIRYLVKIDGSNLTTVNPSKTLEERVSTIEKKLGII